MKNQTVLQKIKSATKDYVNRYGGKESLCPHLIAQIQEELQWQFRNITESQLTYARNLMNSLKTKNN